MSAGVHGDCSATFFVGTPSDRARALVETTKASLIAGIKVCGPGIEFSRIGKAIQFVLPSRFSLLATSYRPRGTTELLQTNTDTRYQNL
jgi:methionine aminopeptidase